MHLYEPAMNICMQGLEFVRESGSSLVSLHAAGEDADRRHCMLAEVLRLSGHGLHVKTISRIAPLGSFEIHPSGHMAGRFELVIDGALDEPARLRAISVLGRITFELQRQWRLIGEMGKSRLVSRLTEICPALIGTAERRYLDAVTEQEACDLLAGYQAFEKLSFLLVVVSVANARMRELMITGKDTVRRLEAVLAVLRKPGTSISIDATNGVRGGDLLRFNSGISAIALILVLIVVLLLKGTGIIDFSYSSYRY